MSGKWENPNVPKKGWACIDIYDDVGDNGDGEDEDLTFLCQMCEAKLIRYVHVMTHPAYEGELEVGCICAGHMELEPGAAVERERAFKNRALRRRNWTRRQWRTSRKGNPFIRVNGFVISVFPQRGGWGGVITDNFTGQTLFAKRIYVHENAAKLAAFDAMELWMKRDGRR
jgi:hypothetical protein